MCGSRCARERESCWQRACASVSNVCLTRNTPFQVQLIEANKPPPQTEGPKLDQESTARQGNLGTCSRCSKPIFGTLIQIEGKRAGKDTWLDLHQECHKCTRCNAVFDDGQVRL